MINDSKPKIVFWGTSDFAVPALQALVDNSYEIKTIVTTPDERAGRKLILTPPPVKIWAKKNHISIYQPETLKNITDLPETDLFIIAAYGKIIPSDILNRPRFGSINIHPSLLPRWRGPSPVQFTILNGDRDTGVSIMKVDDLMDHGPIIATSDKRQVTSQTTYKDLHDDLAKLGAELLVEVLPKYLSGEIKPVAQNDSEATFCKILSKEDGRIDWSQPAEKIERMVRAFMPWPSSWATWPAKDKIYRLRIDTAEVVSEDPSAGSYGYVWQKNKKEILVKTGKGSLKVNNLTLEGKNTLLTRDFLRGHAQIIGSTLI